MAKTGRPSKYTQTIADEICERLAKGEPLAQICRDDHMPGVQTVSDWKEQDESLSVSIARAREDGYDSIANDCLTIADDKTGDPQRDRLRVDTRLKLLSKWDPKRYGDRMTNEHTGAGGAAIEVHVTTTIIDHQRDE